MENWGLVTYRETALLYDPVSSSTGNMERVVTVIAHELAHMVGREVPASSFQGQTRSSCGPREVLKEAELEEVPTPAPDDRCVTWGVREPLWVDH